MKIHFLFIQLVIRVILAQTYVCLNIEYYANRHLNTTFTDSLPWKLAKYLCSWVVLIQTSVCLNIVLADISE